jgi:hypothetical protein
MRIAFPLLLLLLLVSACDTSEPGPSRFTLLTQEAWVPRTPDSVATSVSRFEFREDGTLYLTFVDAESEEEAWEFEENETVLVVRDGGASLRLAVLQLTEVALVIEEILPAPTRTPRRFDLVHP